MKHCCIWSVFGWTQPNICMHEQMLGVMGHSNGDYTSELSLGSWVPCWRARHPTTFLWSSVWLHRKVWKSGCLESVMWRENCTDCLNSNSLRPILKCFHLQAVLKRMANRARVELLFSKIRYKKKKESLACLWLTIYQCERSCFGLRRGGCSYASGKLNTWNYLKLNYHFFKSFDISL